MRAASLIGHPAVAGGGASRCGEPDGSGVVIRASIHAAKPLRTITAHPSMAKVECSAPVAV